MTGIRSEDIIGTDEQWKPFYKRKRNVLADFIIDAKTDDLALSYTMHSKSKFIPEGLQAEGWYPNIGGMEHYISFNAAPIRNSAGELIAAVETFEDLSEIKWTEKTLEESKKRYRILFEESPAAMLVINPDSMIIAGANKAAASYYGYSRQELIGKSMTEIIVSPPSKQVFQMLGEAAHEAHLVQLKNRLQSGEIRDVEFSLRTIDMNGKTYLFSNIHDITNR
jgi:two-component system, NtrC family, sensor kinase